MQSFPYVLIAAVLSGSLAAGCGGGQQTPTEVGENADSADQPRAGSASVPPSTATSPTEETPSESVEVERSASSGPIDLLRGVRSTIAASSAYQNKVKQVERMADGDLETAWNSKSGDLAGAWVDIRLPEKVKVSSIELTVGFTRTTKQSDLFTGNHRIAKVRVHRTGQEVGVFELDTDSRELQSLPVKGPGGTYRLEIVKTVPGTKRRWREVCISELRVMGTAPEAHPGERLPRFAVEKLPEPLPEPGTTDRATISKQLREMTFWFAETWHKLLEMDGGNRTACGLDEDDEDALPESHLERELVLRRVSDFVDLVDEEHAGRIRLAAIKRTRGGVHAWSFIQQGDHDLLSAGFDAVVEWLDEQEARCRWAKANSGMRLTIFDIEVASTIHGCEHMSMDFDDENPAPIEMERECSVVYGFQGKLFDLQRIWEDNPRQAALRISRSSIPSLLSKTTQEAWTKLQAQIEVTRKSCAWP